MIVYWKKTQEGHGFERGVLKSRLFFIDYIHQLKLLAIRFLERFKRSKIIKILFSNCKKFLV